MMGTPVTDVTGFAINLTANRAKESSGKNVGQSFAEVMSERESQMDASSGKKEKPVELKEKNIGEKLENAQTDKSQKASNISENKDEKPMEETDGKLKEVEKEILSFIADALGVTTEEVENAMETLGLSFAQLMEPANLAQLTVELVEEVDTLTLVTDQNLFGTLKELSGQITQTMEQLANELGVDVKELDSMLQEAVKAQKTEEMDSFTMTDGTDGELEATEIPKEVQKADEEKLAVTEDDKATVKETEESLVLSKETDGQNDAKSGQKSFGEEKGQSDLGAKTGNAVVQPQSPFAEAKAAVKMETPVLTPDPESILNQIGEAVQVTSGEEFTSMEMQLHPESLGTLHLQVKAKEGIVTAQLTTENEAVKQILEAQVVLLKEKLEAQGVKVEAVEVSVASHQFERNLEKGNGNENSSFVAKKVTRRKIQLDISEEEELNLDEEEKAARELQKDIMKQNGNTLDYMV